MKNVRQLHATLAASVATTFSSADELRSVLGDVTLPDDLSGWLARLTLLQGVPFNYLVPDERMLPPESIRFVYLDMNWVDALIDGACSIGRNLTRSGTAASANLDRAVRPAMQAQAPRHVAAIRRRMLGTARAAPAATTMATLQVVSGFLLRSTLVADYPGMGVNAYPAGGTPDSGNPNLLTLLRFERLGARSDTLICLVDGDAVRFDIHEAPEQLHYGIDSYSRDASSGAVKAPKTLHIFERNGSQVTFTGRTETVPVDRCFRPGASRLLRMTDLKAIIAQQSKPAIGPAEMGFEMTEGVGNVSFVRKSPGP